MVEKELIQIIERLSFKQIFISISTGLGDSCGGYGWHTVFYLKAVKMAEFCSKCRSNPYHVGNHKYDMEEKVIISEKYIELKKMVADLVLIDNKL